MKKINRAVVVAFHRYTPFGEEFYEPILDFFLGQMKKFEKEYDKLYLVDSTWEIDIKKIEGMKAEILRVDPSLRYYDAYKEVLPQIRELSVLFVDNDMVVYKEGVIDATFRKLENDYDVVSIYDTIGLHTYPQLNGKSKFCPYWFATGKIMLKDFLNIDWGSHMPDSETLGYLTAAMLEEEIIPFEQEEDKSNLFFDGSGDKKGKNLGYYHIRAGSTPAYLLATKEYGDMETYNKYLKEQPRNEYLRHFAWAWYISEQTKDTVVPHALLDVLVSLKISAEEWMNYYEKFIKFHGLQMVQEKS